MKRKPRRTPITKKQVEAAAAAIGLVLGPGDFASRWTESYLPNVKWPDDYSELERERMRNAAADALFAARRA